MTRTYSSKISSLGYFLKSIRALLEKIQRNEHGLGNAPAPILSAVEHLESRLNSCQKGTEIWIKRVEDMNLDSSRNAGYTATLRRGARIVFLTDDFVQIGQQATDHKHGMAADMQILFRCNSLLRNTLPHSDGLLK
jgi:hypothetical protein